MAFDILWMNLAAVFAFANIAFVALLIGLYYQGWRRVPSGFTFGLVIFAVFFLLQNLVVVVFWYLLYGLVPSAQPIVVAAAPYLMLINLTEAIALGNLVRITWR
jgi:hypothetical protein